MTQPFLLGDICTYVTEKVAINDVARNDYVSTENLIAEKGGLSLASRLPPSGKVTKYTRGDILISNIRPYFKKIWYADRDGGASNDVLVLRKTSSVLIRKYLYYVLANDKFFEYSTASSGGSKMPRGDKAQIMKYPVFLPDIKEQQKIVNILDAIDEKIELNRKMNETLEQMGRALFGHYFITNSAVKEWRTGYVSDLVNIYPGFAFKSTDFDPSGEYGLVTIKNVQDGSFVANCTDHLSKPLPSKVPKYAHLSSGSIILSLTGNVGRVCLVVGDNYLLNQRVAKLEGVNGQHSYVYFLFRSVGMKERLFGISRGTAQMNLSPVETKNLKIQLPTDSVMAEFDESASSILKRIVLNNREIKTLIACRETLRPRLISGNLKL